MFSNNGKPLAMIGVYTELKNRYVSHGKTAIENTIKSVEEIVPKIETALDTNHDLWYYELPSDTTDKNI